MKKALSVLLWLSWQSTSLVRMRSRVRIPVAAPNMKIPDASASGISSICPFPYPCSAWRALAFSPDQILRCVQSASGSLQKGALSGSPSGRKTVQHKYRLPVEMYGSPIPGCLPHTPMFSHPSASNMPGHASIRWITAVSAQRTCAGVIPCSRFSRSAACARLWNAP